RLSSAARSSLVRLPSLLGSMNSWAREESVSSADSTNEPGRLHEPTAHPAPAVDPLGVVRKHPRAGFKSGGVNRDEGTGAFRAEGGLASTAAAPGSGRGRTSDHVRG